jgi:predicted PurR-regulated permease PerM
MSEKMLNVLGLFLTLFGLLGSLFAIHLSNWFRELLALDQKFEQNKNRDNDEEKKAVRECRYKLRELYNHVTATVSAILTVFLMFVFWRGEKLITSQATPDPVVSDLALVASAFFIVYLFLTLFFLTRGYWVGYRLNKALNPQSQS